MTFQHGIVSIIYRVLFVICISNLTHLWQESQSYIGFPKWAKYLIDKGYSPCGVWAEQTVGILLFTNKYHDNSPIKLNAVSSLLILHFLLLDLDWIVIKVQYLYNIMLEAIKWSDHNCQLKGNFSLPALKFQLVLTVFFFLVLTSLVMIKRKRLFFIQGTFLLGSQK